MSCVWNSLLTGLRRGEIKHDFKARPIELIMHLKENNKLTEHITVNEEEPTEKQLEENKEAIKELNKKIVSTGYWCSTCDPVLILFCEIFSVNINHTYLSSVIKYNHSAPKFTICLSSNKGHMTFSKILPIHSIKAKSRSKSKKKKFKH